MEDKAVSEGENLKRSYVNEDCICFHQADTCSVSLPKDVGGILPGVSGWFCLRKPVACTISVQQRPQDTN